MKTLASLIVIATARVALAQPVFTYALAPAGESPAATGDTVIERDVLPGVNLIEVTAFLKSSGLPGRDGAQGWCVVIAHDPCMNVDGNAIDGVTVSTIYDHDRNPDTPPLDPFILDLKDAGFRAVDLATGDYAGSPVPGAQGVISCIVLHQTQKMVLHANATDPMLRITYRIDVAAGETVVCGARFVDRLACLDGGCQPPRNVVTVGGSSTVPVTQSLILRLHGVPPGGRQVPGDCNQDGSLDISDSACVFGVLFLGRPSLFPCGDGSLGDPGNLHLLDWQPDGEIDISDGAGLLGFLFLGTKLHPLAAPENPSSACVRLGGCADTDACAP